MFWYYRVVPHPKKPKLVVEPITEKEYKQIVCAELREASRLLVLEPLHGFISEVGNFCYYCLPVAGEFFNEQAYNMRIIKRNIGSQFRYSTYEIVFEKKGKK